MIERRRDEERLLAEVQADILRSDTGERRWRRSFSVELLLEGGYPDTCLPARARYGTDDEVVWEDTYPVWYKPDDGSAERTLDRVGPLLLRVHLDEDLGSSSYFLWREARPD